MEATRLKNTGVAGRDNGSVTVLSLLVLVILTLLGIGVLTSSTSDTRSAQNENVYRRNFSRAEAAVRGGMQALQDEITADPRGPNLRDYTMPGLIKATTQGVLPDPTDPLQWQASPVSVPVIDADCRYRIVETRIDGSLDATASQIRSYVVFGRSTQLNGEAVIRVGYRVRLQPAI